MRVVSWSLVLLLAGCAARQATPSAASSWSDGEKAEMHQRCYAAWVGQGMAAGKGDAVCSCLVPRFAARFSHDWLDDGRPVTSDEASAIATLLRGCAADVASAEPDHGAGAGTAM